MNLIPGKSKYEPVDALIDAPEYKFMDIKSLSASRVNLADANKEYTEAEKELSRQRSIRYEYFARQVELLKFDFVEEKYEKFIQGAEVLLEEDLDPSGTSCGWSCGTDTHCLGRGRRSGRWISRRVMRI